MPSPKNLPKKLISKSSLDKDLRKVLEQLAKDPQ
jgi:hypothetical protein